MNRIAIRKALEEYKNSKKQSKAIWKDKDIQGLFKQGRNEEAVALINSKYPEGQNRNVNQKAITLIEEMTKSIPEWKGINPMDVYSDLDTFDKLLVLAERV
ncbi:hypothetical protein [Paenibacillus elgii]|uniref:hypothetical protein n=1 Tax=Paenibacillus elgii TaxID=189691 RepID=UPI002041C07F|nr:hypothetical protein [Paenibacillus elgii]MCM3273059.1 hypothetical protein [Paenibacillus elgii]